MTESDQKIDFAKIEKKWQDKWESEKIFEVSEDKNKKKFYVLEMFPYPSAEGLHMGHAFNFTIGDVFARFKKMQGFNVLHPMGFDSLGLPAENAAIKVKKHPEDYTNNSIKNFIKQQKGLGIGYDWSRKVNTADPDYYKWDQWIFLKMFEKGLVYEKEAPVNWCSKCNTILANEQVHDGKCWRHDDTDVEVKNVRQLFLKITDYADRLLEGHKNLKWPEKTIAMQKNWIGKSFGTEIDFIVNGKKWPIFTTRADTIFGVTFMVVAAQHPRLSELVTKEQKKEVDAFLKKLKSVSEKDLSEMDKVGVFTGSYAINPSTGTKIPIWAANFVIADYGSGMVMADAHDQRDLEFAQKYKINLIETILPEDKKSSDPNKAKRAFTDYGVLVNSGEFSGLKSKEAIEKISEWLASQGKARKVVNYKLRDWSVARQRYWGTPIPLIHCDNCKKNVEKSVVLGFYDDESFNNLKSGKKSIETRAINTTEEEKKFYANLKEGDYIKCENKNSGSFFYLEVTSSKIYKNLKELFKEKEAIKKIFPDKEINSLTDLEKNYAFTEDYIKRIENNGLVAWNVKTVNPGLVPVPVSDLPVKLPKEVKFGEGNPLLTNEEWLSVKCPKCNGKAQREANTMDTFVNSSWYFLRYCDAQNKKEIFSKDKAKYWMPVDLYIGGAEHACMHLIYSRFYTMFLKDLGLIDFEEPAPRLFHQGMINGYDGQRMSKSKGNGVEPLETIAKYGVDATRFYILSEASPDKGFNWTDSGIQGATRIINKVLSISENVKFGKDSEELSIQLNKTIKNAAEQIENLDLRKTTIELRALFELISQQKEVSKETFGKALKLLAPFCPHIAEELWEKLGNKGFISTADWPTYEEIKEKKSILDLNTKIIENTKPVIDKVSQTQKISKVYLYVMPFEINQIDKKKIEKEFGFATEIFAVNDPNKKDPENKAKKSLPGKPGVYFE